MRTDVKSNQITWLKVLGLLLLIVLLVRVDFQLVLQTLSEVDLVLLGLSIVLILPLIFIKALRWWAILHAQTIEMSILQAYLAYFSSLFLGFLTPGRLGEFSRVFYVREVDEVSTGVALSSVLADRLFDLFALLFVGGAGLLSFRTREFQISTFLIALGLITLPLILFLYDRSFLWVKQLGVRVGNLGRRIFSKDGFLMGVRSGLRQLNRSQFLLSIILTGIAYTVFFSQCYLIGLALNIRVGYAAIAYAIALGSLITLVPISISGLGTREAVITAYLALVGVSPVASISFSLLVFFTFYIVGGLFGAIAWWLKPINLKLEPTPSESTEQ
jgi:uncharacterized protein (TIRG00374 family)